MSSSRITGPEPRAGGAGDDQIADWARRMEMEEGEARRGLAGVL
jgi:hypothetical protein